MNLVVDYGNSSAKLGIFDQQILKEKHTFRQLSDLEKYLSTSEADHLIVSSVSADAPAIIGWAERIHKKYILTHRLPLPVTLRYSTPETLGVDRIAGVCGACELFPDTNILVIDAGTCVKYDFVDRERNFLGGGIGPGLKMRFQAVHEFTSKLPLVEAVDHAMLVGNSTAASIQSGVVFGMVTELDGMIALYREQYPELKVVLTGGDSGFFENKLKASIFASPNVVLIGLNRILNHNVELS